MHGKSTSNVQAVSLDHSLDQEKGREGQECTKLRLRGRIWGVRSSLLFPTVENQIRDRAESEGNIKGNKAFRNL